MSFDRVQPRCNDASIGVSIPLEQGNVFRQEQLQRLITAEVVSIPLEQGNVFRRVNR